VVPVRPTGCHRARPRCSRLVAQDLANTQIARALGITEGTVKAHLGRVFREIGVLDRTSAAPWARDNLPGA